MPRNEPASAAPGSSPVAGRQRSIVFVAGSGRSGTSTMSGVLQQLGLYVPQPEVVADETNPRGFGEPQWVVDLHSALLSRARVHASDARPSAWGEADGVVTDVIRHNVDNWLGRQFDDAAVNRTAELVVKDPRLSWFLPMWITAAEHAGATPCVVTMLRPPTEVVGSKSRYYGGRMADSNRTAAWVNMMLQTEFVTRNSRRAFVSYHDLLADWTTVLYRVGQTLSLYGVENASTDNIRRVHQFVDPTLRRVTIGWDDIEVPTALREIASQTWEQLNALREPDTDQDVIHKRLDELRAQYDEEYRAAELIAMSSVIAARRSHPPGTLPLSGHAPGRLDRVAWLLPHAVRSKIPIGVRRLARSGLSRLRGGTR